MNPRVCLSLVVLISLVSWGVGANREPIPEADLAAARRQAELLHTTVHATLHTVHERFQRDNEGLPPASGSLPCGIGRSRGRACSHSSLAGRRR